MRRKGESPRFNAALKDFNNSIALGDTVAATKHLTAHFDKMIVAAETMIASNPYINVSLVNAFEEDFTSLNVNRINGIEKIKAFLKADESQRNQLRAFHIFPAFFGGGFYEY